MTTESSRSATPPTDVERLAVLGAREIADDEVVFVGIGVPSHAAVLARRTHAPGSTLVYESGVIGSLPATPPLSTGSPSVARGAMLIADSLLVFNELQAGRINVGLLSAAQVDLHGNLNSTVIGPYATPKHRLVGSGGAHDIALLAGRVIILMPHEPRRFVARVDFVTSPGTRARSRPPTAGGPACVITPYARFGFDEDGILTLEAVAAGTDPDELLANLPEGVRRAGAIGVLPDPDPAAVEILRRDVLGDGEGQG